MILQPRPPQWDAVEINRDSQQAQGLVAWWLTRSWDAVNCRGQDMTGVYPGTVAGAVTARADATRGWYYNSDGAAGSYILFGTGNPANPAAITLSAWILPQPSMAAANGYILGKGADNVANSYGLFLATTSGAVSSMNAAMLANTDVIATAASVGAGKVGGGVWHLLVGTIKGSAINMYVDGLRYTGSATTRGGETLVTSATQLRIGGQNRASYNYPFKGAIQDVRIYNRVLTAGEIQALYDPATRWELYQGGPQRRVWANEITPPVSGFKAAFAAGVNAQVGVN